MSKEELLSAIDSMVRQGLIDIHTAATLIAVDQMTSKVLLRAKKSN